MNKYLVLIIASIFIFSCKSKQKIQTIQKAIEAKDTSKAVIIKQTETIDSVAIIKDMLKKIVSNKIDFNTFYAKVKVQYTGQDEEHKATAYVSIRKDSLIIIRLSFPVMGISVNAMNVKITKDSVVFVKTVDGPYVQMRSINYLQDITQIPFTFQTLQDLLVGNPVFVNENNIVNYRQANNNQTTVLTVGDIFKNLLSINNETKTITHCKLDDIEINRNRTCDITYSNFTTYNNLPFSGYRSISVAEKSRLDVNLDYKEFTFNEPLKFKFDIPKKYPRK